MNKKENLLCTSNGVPLSKKNNWLSPIEGFKESCYICSYYGHGYEQCTNILKSYLRSCFKCWNKFAHANSSEHKGCNLPPCEAPFKENYKKPEELVKLLGSFEE